MTGCGVIRLAAAPIRDIIGAVLIRALLVGALVAVGATIPSAHADPPCPASGCPHGPAGPPAVNVNSPSYKDGYRTEHEYFAVPQNHAYLASEMKTGYTASLVCQVEMSGGSAPPSPDEWIAGCVAALHDLGFTP